MITRNTVTDVREYFVNALENEDFVEDKSGCKMIELVGASFIADEPTIFGKVNEDYVSRELEWYKSQSLSVNDIPGGPPEIWKQVADIDGYINSNYGYLIWNSSNYNQFQNVIEELQKQPFSRRAVMIYTRPSMWYEYNKLGMSDFICTNVVQYFIRNEKVHAVVQMRSNDIWAGYRNDFAWQKYVLERVSEDLNLPSGDIIWNAGSLHCYERNFYLIDHYSKTGEISITKKEYDSKQQ